MWAGPTYTTKIVEEGGRLDRALKDGLSDPQIIEEFYLAGPFALSERAGADGASRLYQPGAPTRGAPGKPDVGTPQLPRICL